jgi:hypothetical protein
MSVAPNWQATGTVVSAAAAPLTVAWPSVAIGDVGLLFIETDGADTPTLSTPGDFVADAITSGGTGTRLTMFWALARSTSPTSPVIAATADRAQAVIVTVRGANYVGNPIHASGSNVQAANTAVSIAGITTTANDCLIVIGVAGDNLIEDGNFSGWTNASLGSLTERVDAGTLDGSNGGLAVATGTLAAAGASGTTTATLGDARATARILVALNPNMPMAYAMMLD